MQRLVYYLTIPFLWVVSLLPFSVFYIFSDVICFLVYRIIGYRKKTVTTNLQYAFPEKTRDEILAIRHDFYHHFCDLFLEMIKTGRMSKEQLQQRFKLKNPEELKRIQGLNKGNLLMMAHYASYEWVVALPYQGLTFKSYGIYKKVKNKYFDHLIKSSRGKHGTVMIDKNRIQRQMIKNTRAGKAASYGMIADQAPKGGRTKYWRSFMGHEVPVFIGSEVMAKKLDLAVTYLKITKPKRGYYEVEIIPLADNPKEFADYEITDRYFELLEAQIEQEPAHYLWSHRRWKHVIEDKAVNQK